MQEKLFFNIKLGKNLLNTIPKAKKKKKKGKKERKKLIKLDFSGDAVDKNLPGPAGDAGLISGPGTLHMPYSS